MVDADLSILGAPPDEFDRYEGQIRREYAFVPEAEWRERRPRILRRFLDRPRIFETPEFARLEAPARSNLSRSTRAARGVAGGQPREPGPCPASTVSSWSSTRLSRSSTWLTSRPAFTFTR